MEKSNKFHTQDEWVEHAKKKTRKSVNFVIPEFLKDFNKPRKRVIIRKEKEYIIMNEITLYNFLESYRGKEVYICLKHLSVIGGLSSEVILLNSIKWSLDLKDFEQAIADFEEKSNLEVDKIIVTGWDLREIDNIMHMVVYIDNKRNIRIPSLL